MINKYFTQEKIKDLITRLGYSLLHIVNKLVICINTILVSINTSWIAGVTIFLLSIGAMLYMAIDENPEILTLDPDNIDTTMLSDTFNNILNFKVKY